MLACKLRYGLLSLLIVATISNFGIAQEETTKPLVILEDGYHNTDLHLHVNQSFRKNNIDSALIYAKEALIISEQLGDKKETAMSLFNLGELYIAVDSVILARKYMHDALELTSQCANCDTLVAWINLFLGKSYILHDNFAEAITYFLRSLHIAEQHNISEILTDLYDDLGMVMMFLEDYEQALNYFNLALETSTNIGSRISQANVLRNMGFVLLIRDRYDSADIFINRALSIFEEEGYLPGMSFAHVGLGNSDFARNAYPSALAHFQAALEESGKIGFDLRITVPFIKTLCLNRLGETYLKMGMLDESKKVLSQSIKVSKEHTLPRRRAFASKYLSEVYEAQGDKNSALSYYKKYNLLHDSLVSARIINLITKLEMEYQYLKQQKEKEIQQLEKEEAYKRKVLLYELLIGVAVIMVVLLGLILILYRKNQRARAQKAELTQENLELEKENLQKELEYKNRELTTSVMYQLKKNNFIWSISEKLKSIALHLRPEHKKSVSEIIKEMDSSMTKESWEEFEFRFNEVHNNFYDNLIKDYPELTPNELKLSAFLRLNMTTKDIATITYQTNHSITVARHRLRNKLNLERDDNLVTYLSRY